MLWFKRILAVFALFGLTACGFEPVYKENASARAMLEQIDVEVKSGRFDFALRNGLLERLGQGGQNAPYVLRYQMSVKSSALVISDTADITRFVLNGQVTYQIVKRDSNTQVYENTVRAATAYSATSGTYPTEVARKDANIRLSHAMAERIVDQLALSAQDWLP